MRLSLKNLYLVAFFFPVLAHAAPRTFKGLVEILVSIFNVVVPLIFSLALLAFLWGILQYVIFPGSEDRKSTGKQVMIWGIVVLSVMTAVWGIVSLLSTAFL